MRIFILNTFFSLLLSANVFAFSFEYFYDNDDITDLKDVYGKCEYREESCKGGSCNKSIWKKTSKLLGVKLQNSYIGADYNAASKLIYDVDTEERKYKDLDPQARLCALRWVIIALKDKQVHSKNIAKNLSLVFCYGNLSCYADSFVERAAGDLERSIKENNVANIVKDYSHLYFMVQSRKQVLFSEYARRKDREFFSQNKSDKDQEEQLKNEQFFNINKGDGNYTKEDIQSYLESVVDIDKHVLKPGVDRKDAIKNLIYMLKNIDPSLVSTRDDINEISKAIVDILKLRRACHQSYLVNYEIEGDMRHRRIELLIFYTSQLVFRITSNIKLLKGETEYNRIMASAMLTAYFEASTEAFFDTKNDDETRVTSGCVMYYCNCVDDGNYNYCESHLKKYIVDDDNTWSSYNFCI